MSISKSSSVVGSDTTNMINTVKNLSTTKKVSINALNSIPSKIEVVNVQQLQAAIHKLESSFNYNCCQENCCQTCQSECTCQTQCKRQCECNCCDD